MIIVGVYPAIMAPLIASAVQPGAGAARSVDK